MKKRMAAVLLLVVMMVATFTSMSLVRVTPQPGVPPEEAGEAVAAETNWTGVFSNLNCGCCRDSEKTTEQGGTVIRR